jgi:hypothetical protein
MAAGVVSRVPKSKDLDSKPATAFPNLKIWTPADTFVVPEIYASVLSKKHRKASVC